MRLTNEFDTNGRFPFVPKYLITLPYDEQMKKTPTYM
jgi:hypothetical protein